MCNCFSSNKILMSLWKESLIFCLRVIKKGHENTALELGGRHRINSEGLLGIFHYVRLIQKSIVLGVLLSRRLWRRPDEFEPPKKWWEREVLTTKQTMMSRDLSKKGVWEFTREHPWGPHVGFLKRKLCCKGHRVCIRNVLTGEIQHHCQGPSLW